MGICKVCGASANYNRCGETRDDNWALHYPEDEYCSSECYRQSEDYLKNAPTLLKLWGSMDEEQRQLFQTYMANVGENESDEWRYKLEVAQRTNYKSGAKETTRDRLVEVYEGFEVRVVETKTEYPDHNLDQIMEQKFYATCKARAIRLPIEKKWRAMKEYKDGCKWPNYNSEIPESLRQVCLDNIYSIIDLIVKHGIDFHIGGKGYQKAATQSSIDVWKKKMEPLWTEWCQLNKNVTNSQQRKDALELDSIVEDFTIQ